MAEEFEKYAILRSMFRRRSSTEFTSDGRMKQIVDEKTMSNLLDQFGAHVGQKELHEAVAKIVPMNKEGKLSFEDYTKVCDRFVKDPTDTPTAMEFHSFNDFNTLQV